MTETPISEPYLSLIDTRHGFKIWSVNGSYVRTHIDEEFTNFGQHHRFPFIPHNEFWIDRESNPDEQEFFIEHLLIEHQLMNDGMDYVDAISIADDLEREMRRLAGDNRAKTRSYILKKIKSELFRTLGNNIEVWVVNGRLVRSIFNIDFTEGGHYFIYKFVPRREIWIDDDITDEERPYILFHELHERNLMSMGMTYDEAHADSSRLEYHYRQHPDELEKALIDEAARIP